MKAEDRKQLEALREMFDYAVLEATDIPRAWPTLTCQNPGHKQKPEQHGADDDWRCPDCGSTWWAVDGTPIPAASHVEAFLFRVLRSLADSQPDREDQERPLDVDGPILLALREEVSTLLPAEGLLDEEGAELHANDPVVERIGDKLSAHVADCLDTALRSLAESQEQDADCEHCDDTGIYREGDEWAPCDECQRGRDFAECLQTAVRESQEQRGEGDDLETVREKTERLEADRDHLEALVVETRGVRGPGGWLRPGHLDQDARVQKLLSFKSLSRADLAALVVAGTDALEAERQANQGEAG